MSEITNPVAMREKIMALETGIQQLPQVDCPVRNFWCNGMYAREMTIPAGTVLTGAVHKTEHFTIISKGRMHLMTDDGVVEVAAPYIGTSKAGIKRVGFAIEETVVTTFHVTDETDLEKVVAELSETPIQQLMGGPDNVQHKNHLLKE